MTALSALQTLADQFLLRDVAKDRFVKPQRCADEDNECPVRAASAVLLRQDGHVTCYSAE